MSPVSTGILYTWFKVWSMKTTKYSLLGHIQVCVEIRLELLLFMVDSRCESNLLYFFRVWMWLYEWKQA